MRHTAYSIILYHWVDHMTINCVVHASLDFRYIELLPRQIPKMLTTLATLASATPTMYYYFGSR